MLNCRVVPSPVGDLRVFASPRGIKAVLWPDDDPKRVRGLDGATEVARGDDSHIDRAENELAEYFAGTRRTFDVDLDPEGTDFQKAAWQVLRTIPYGSTMNYGQQATALGDAKKARAVGAANGRNPISIIVPCHRVVGANGSLTGFAGGLDAKKFLLALESR